jgi:hypothetical protein
MSGTFEQQDDPNLNLDRLVGVAIRRAAPCEALRIDAARRF